MNNFKHYAVTLLSCVGVAGMIQAEIPEAGYIKNGTDQQALITVIDTSGNKLIDDAGLAPEEKIQLDESFDKIEKIQVKLGTQSRPVTLSTGYHKKIKGAMPLKANTQHDTLEVTDKYMDGKLHVAMKNSAERHAEGFQEVRAVKQQRPVRYKRISRGSAAGCSTCGQVIEQPCSTCGQ